MQTTTINYLLHHGETATSGGGATVALYLLFPVKWGHIVFPT